MTAMASVLAGVLLAAGPGGSAVAASPEESVVTDPGIPNDGGACVPGLDESTWIDRRTGEPCVPLPDGEEARPTAPGERNPDMRPGGSIEDTAPGGQGMPEENRGDIGNVPPPEDVDVPRVPDEFAPPMNTDPGGGSGSILSPGVGGTSTPEFTPVPGGDPRR